MARRTKDQIAADAAADAKLARMHARVAELCASIKSGNHKRNRGLVVQLSAQLHQVAVALLDAQTAAAKASVPPVVEEADPSNAQSELVS